MLISVGNISFNLKITIGNTRDIVRFAHSSPEGLLVDADYFLRHGAKNNRHPRKSPTRRVSEANNVA
jgi:hypothetical protein